MKIEEFRDIIFILSRAIPKWSPPFKEAETLQVWYSAFKDIQPENLKAAAKLAINTLDEFPSIKKLKELSGTNGRTDEQVGQGVADEIAECIRKYGAYQIEEAAASMSPLAWEMVQRNGGWPSLCQIESDKQLEFRKRDLATSAMHRYQEGRARNEDLMFLEGKPGNVISIRR